MWCFGIAHDLMTTYPRIWSWLVDVITRYHRHWDSASSVHSREWLGWSHAHWRCRSWQMWCTGGHGCGSHWSRRCLLSIWYQIAEKIHHLLLIFLRRWLFWNYRYIREGIVIHSQYFLPCKFTYCIAGNFRGIQIFADTHTLMPIMSRWSSAMMTYV